MLKDRILKDRQEILVLGELALFLAAWGLGLGAAVNDHRERTNASAENNVAANSNFSGSGDLRGDFPEPSFAGQGFSGQVFSGLRGDFEWFAGIFSTPSSWEGCLAHSLLISFV